MSQYPPNVVDVVLEGRQRRNNALLPHTRVADPAVHKVAHVVHRVV